MAEYIIDRHREACMELALMAGDVETATLITATFDANKTERLIRCRDCKHRAMQTFYGEVQGHICYLTEQSVTLDDYCSKAEEEEL